jgi:hypothetical protein
MSEEAVSFSVSDVPFGPVQTVTVTVGFTAIQLTGHNLPGLLAVETPANGFRYVVSFQLADNSVYTMPAATSSSLNVFIPSPFRTETVSLYVIRQTANKMIQDFTMNAEHQFGEIVLRHSWQGPSDSQKPWNVITTAPVGAFLVHYAGKVLLSDGTGLPIPGSVEKYGLINISPIQFGFTVILDPSAIEWQNPALDKVIVSVYQLNAQNQMVDIQAAVFSGPSTERTYLEYLAYYEVGIVFYYDAEYWYAGEAQARKLRVTEETTAQAVTLPAKIPVEPA